jgi:hypothetical protein
VTSRSGRRRPARSHLLERDASSERAPDRAERVPAPHQRSAPSLVAVLAALAAALLLDVTPPARLAIAAPAAQPTSVAPAAPPRALPITTVLLDAKDVRRSTLVGPSGQIYEPLSAPSASAPPSPSPAATTAARWVRRTAGGVSATVAGAARLDGELLISGAQTPLFRQRQGQWLLAQLGQRGRVLFSAGPFFAVAIGRQIFVQGKAPARASTAATATTSPRLLRVGTAPGNVVSLWAASEASIYLVTDQGVFRRRGNAFQPALKLPGVLGLTGAAPHAVTVDTAINLRSGARVRLTGQALRVGRSESTPAAILRAPTGALVLARDLTTSAGNVELPAAMFPSEPPSPRAPASPGASDPAAPSNLSSAPGSAVPGSAVSSSSGPAIAAVDAAGRALVTGPAGLLVYDGTTWITAVLTDELPPPRAGPAPARSR